MHKTTLKQRHTAAAILPFHFLSIPLFLFFSFAPITFRSQPRRRSLSGSLQCFHFPKSSHNIISPSTSDFCVFSMASSLEDDLSCPVCCELYQDPQLLCCGHTFCHQCLKKHWTVNTARTCPLCRRVSLQEPVDNLALRSTIESYQREKEKERKERESDGEVKCSRHGEKIQFFCKTDDEVICSKCRKDGHRLHRVQHLAHAVRQHKVRKTGRERERRTMGVVVQTVRVGKEVLFDLYDLISPSHFTVLTAQLKCKATLSFFLFSNPLPSALYYLSTYYYRLLSAA